MVLSPTIKDTTGSDDIHNEKMILMKIQENKIIAVQSLLTQLVESREMSKSTMYRHINNLLESKDIVKQKRGMEVYYCLPGITLPEESPPSGIDHFLLDEAKKLVSDILSSGALSSFPTHYDSDTKTRLFQRCWYLDKAFTELGLRRWGLNINSWMLETIQPNVLYKGQKVAGVVCFEDVEPSLEEELFHLMGVIDSFSRYLDQNSQVEKKIVRRKKRSKVSKPK